MITPLTNKTPCATAFPTKSPVAFKGNHVEEAYNRARNIVLSTVPKREYDDRKQYILDCMDGKKELDTEKFLKNPNDRKKNLLILTDITGESLKDYITAIKQNNKTALSDDNHPINKNVLKAVDFWNNKISDEDRKKYIYIKEGDECMNLYGLTDKEWIYGTYDFLQRKTAQMAGLHEERNDLDSLQEYLKD